MKFNEFLNKIQYHFSSEEKELLKRAFDLTISAHAGQKRFSGEDYSTHPISAALILAQILPDATTIAATLLHDVPEDTSYTLDQVREQFGDKVGMLVGGVTKLGKVRLRNSKDKSYTENLRKMFVATSQDVRVIIIKLADRLHNMRTIDFVKAAKRKRIAEETLEIYAPIASRLGIGEWKDELEDRAFRVVDPEGYEQTAKLLKERLPESEIRINDLKKNLAKVMHMEGVKFKMIKGRVKRIYSLHKKLKKYDGDISKIYDLIALRVIVKSTEDCYAALGAIHKHMQPLPGRVKDFIALPKPNGYRSIHTSVFSENRKVFEIQIRTQQMDDQAERGIAAHWLYNEMGKPDQEEMEYEGNTAKPALAELQWVQDLQKLHEQAKDSKDFFDQLKIDFFRDRIFVLTPKGDVKDLPEGATPIDFAFSVHTDLGFCILGAKVNGKMVKLDHELKSGDMVEIIKSKKPAKISQDWLANSKTTLAHHQIRKYLNENQTGIFNMLKNMIIKK